MSYLKYILVILCLVFQSKLFSQVIDSLKAQSVGFSIVYGDTFHNYPDTLEITGKIEEISFGVSCGIMCASGTIRIKPNCMINNYPAECVYVVIPCLSGKSVDKYLCKCVNIKVKKVTKKINTCYLKNIFNNINSNNIPFYYYDYEKEGELKVSISH